MQKTIRSMLLSGLSVGLLISSSQALAFDPNEAIYERYRNKEATRINNDGTVTIGKLQWMRCSLGQSWNGTTCTGDASSHRATHTLNDERALLGLINAQGGFAGYRDWRKPTISELASLRRCSSGRAEGTINLPGGVTTFERCSGNYSQPTLDTRLFPNTPESWFWSQSPGAYYSYYGTHPTYTTWGVSFGNGHVYYYFRIYDFRVRLVRAVQ